MITFFYGYLERRNKALSWELLRKKKSIENIPWVCLLDFNQILSQDKKMGGNPIDLFHMMGFYRALMDCNLFDLGCIRYNFTRSNMRNSLIISMRD